ncbi:MAG: CBS domain-containing protein [Desulfobacterales bacterium]|jgi:CBS domain-containing protein|nr:CBS domain-containing protein [Desulfobacteraceae bacterium]MBT4365782.1 CBS domain-containing protein [Desulfobacteraceae bacterium]MBT7085743.1 CBS domain-containing protein [Desulfobacterales bacterium]MBT7697010.1 CBS domain-containing protein [Desulfobacterales bacterium]
MTLYAKDIMVSNFDTIHMDAPIEEAIIKISKGKVRETGYKTISLMVVDDLNKLCGVVSMFDILYHLRPDFLNFGIDGEELQWEGQIKTLIDKFKDKKVHHIMSRNIIGADMDDHIMIILDRMVKKKYRRLPVLKNDKLIGIVYLSDIYHRLFSNS